MQLPESVRRMSSSAKMATASVAFGTVTATMTVVTIVTSSVICANVQTKSSGAQTEAALLSTGTVTETRTVKMDQMRKIA
ncbi:hypothetical protein XENORESO_019957, partial [Xenotaenia resolanae]